MIRYRNLSGDSGVSAYEFGPDSITVQFSDGDAYLYDAWSAGASNIAQMKALAERGCGLNSFINVNVRKKYRRRLS